MKQTVICKCDEHFEVEVPESIQIDLSVQKSIQDGSFMNYQCPKCGNTIATEFLTKCTGSHGTFYFVPELDRFAFLNGTTTVPRNSDTVIGFNELKERIAVIKNDLDPFIIESLKIVISRKIVDSIHHTHFDVYFTDIECSGVLVFYVIGLKDGEIACMRLPESMYAEMQNTANCKRNEEPYVLLIHNGYCSVKNIDFGE